MANEKSAPAPHPAAETTPTPPRKGGMKIMIVAGLVVALELVTVFVTISLSSGPRRVIAEVPQLAASEPVEKDSEVKLIDAKLPNTQSGKLYLYDLAVVAKVAEKNKDKVSELFSEREAEIRDQVRAIIASSDPRSLAEPGLETLRRQIGYQLEQVIGKELIKELLIPKCTPIRAEM